MSEAIILYAGMVQFKIFDHYSGLQYCLAGYSSYHIGEPSLIPKLLLPCVYIIESVDSIRPQFVDY